MASAAGATSGVSGAQSSGGSTGAGNAGSGSAGDVAGGGAAGGGAAGGGAPGGGGGGGNGGTAGSASAGDTSMGGVAGSEGGAPAGEGGEPAGGTSSTGGTSPQGGGGDATTAGTATGGAGGDDSVDGGDAGSSGEGGSAPEPRPDDCRMGYPTAPLLSVGGDRPSPALGDLNGDGLADMVVAGKDGSHELGVLSVFVATANGFTDRRDIDVAGSPSSAQLIDLDGDDELDIVVAVEGPTPSVTTIINQGGGNLAAPVAYPGCQLAHSMAVADLNGDDFADVVIACWLYTSLEVHLNNGDGTFAPKVGFTHPDQPFAPTAVVAGDLDGDGDADLATSDDRKHRISVWMNDGDASFAAPVDYEAGYMPVDLALGDLDDNGSLDLAAAAGYGLDVLRNQGDGSFGEHHAFEIMAYLLNPSSVVLADIDGDGLLDAGLSTNNGLGYAVTFLNVGDAEFALDSSIDLSGEGWSTNVHDVNGDDLLDLIVGLAPQMDSANTSIAIFQGVGDGYFASNITINTTDSWCNGLMSEDLDSDGDNDLMAVCNTSPPLVPPRIDVFWNEGGGAFTRTLAYACGGVNSHVAVADFNDDGLLDLLGQCGGSTNTDISVRFAQPGRTFANPVYYEAGPVDEIDPANSFGAAGDFDDDGDVDFVVGNQGDVNLRVFFNDGSGAFSSTAVYPLTTSPVAIEVGDLNDDGTLDLALTRRLGGVLLYSNDGNGTFTFEKELMAGSDPGNLVIADMTGDGSMDLVVSNSIFDSYGNSTVSLLTSTGTLTYTKQDFTVREDAGSLSVADTDLDGKLDIVVTNGGGSTVSLLHNEGNGDFSHRAWIVTEYPGPNVVQDLDDDGWPDLAVITFERGLRILPNRCW